ncbi:conserved hypothetical protein [Methylocella tundrae]|uniref:Uncharacterized protein n=1 Tax=Methylocella tundrae TaxID=227605 RepID=A0A8B6M1U5_METTU|nr:hypothetical protein [Methylocella tundrae]VTZ27436.1 conserved hypothetical protein [Methylocella tundrae]VTZ48449.1 conserved hypothetical protein [Methylocella tundrae]
MTQAQIYQHGMKAYIEGSPLSGNPYNATTCPAAYDAWTDGWLDAMRARRRIHALKIAAYSHIRPAPRAAGLFA